MKLYCHNIDIIICRRPPCGGRGLKRFTVNVTLYLFQSPPVRGAWIETAKLILYAQDHHRSPPVRGAWIETLPIQGVQQKRGVAPRAGGVD